MLSLNLVSIEFNMNTKQKASFDKFKFIHFISTKDGIKIECLIIKAIIHNPENQPNSKCFFYIDPLESVIFAR